MPVWIYVVAVAAFASASGQAPKAGTIVFSRVVGDYWQVFDVRPDGTGLRQVTSSDGDKRNPAWLGARGDMVYQSSNGRLFRREATTGHERPLLADLGYIIDPAPAPDGGRIAFVRFRSEVRDNAEVWVSDLAGEALARVYRSAGVQDHPAWSPAGDRIAFAGHGPDTEMDIFSMDSYGTDVRALTDALAADILPCWSPLGNRIAFVSYRTGDPEIWTMAPDGGDLRQVTDCAGLDTEPSWSPDGRRLAFTSNRSGTAQLWTCDQDGGDPRQITDGPAPSRYPCWGPGGEE